MKRIFFTQRVEMIEGYNERRDCCDQNIVKLIFSCGYLPIPVPNNIDVVKNIMSELEPDGILLTGGNTLKKYHGNAPERDFVEYSIIDYAIEHRIPVLGICRGMQLIMDYFSIQLNNVQNHVRVRHKIHGIMPRNQVNSFHNMACIDNDKVKNSFVVLSSAEDDVVESVQHKCYPIAGIMWHPERENPFNYEDIKMIKSFFSEKGGRLV